MMIPISLLICLLVAVPSLAQQPNCAQGPPVILAADNTLWICSGAGATAVQVPLGGGGVPQGAIIFIDAGTCPTGFEEASELSGKTIIGTVAANKDVGTTGGSDTITPEGEVTAPTFTGTPFTDVINHTHPVTDPGHTHVEQNNSATTGGLAGWGARDTSTNTAVATGYSTQSATTGVTTNNPAGGVASITPAGTNSAPSFTGTEHDNRSAFIKVIGCRKS